MVLQLRRALALSSSADGAAAAASSSLAQASSSSGLAPAPLSADAAENDRAVSHHEARGQSQRDPLPMNPWNRFQQEQKGKGLSVKTMAKIYNYEKAKRK